MEFRGIKLLIIICQLLALSFLFWPGELAATVNTSGRIRGIVTDTNGTPVSQVKVTLLTPQQAVVATVTTDETGQYSFAAVPVGSYVLLASKPELGTQRAPVQVTAAGLTELSLQLELNPLSYQVTVTAETGQAQDKDRVAQEVNIIGEEALQQRATAVLAQVADEEVGVALQRTSPTIGGIFVRGLAGKNVAVYVDGVRYTTSTGRGGINTFFNLNDPAALRAVEILRGPNSAQYGSDSLGGTVQLISRTPIFGGEMPETHGEINTFFTSADLSFGGNTLVTYGARRFGLLAQAGSRRVNTMRPAHGLDSHSAVTRFLGLPSDIFGARLSDTAFTQYGGLLRLNYAPAIGQQVVLHYQRSQQDGGKRYDQLLGGDGNLVADLRNLMLDFAYARYDRQKLGFFDNGAFTISFNSQREERVNQGGQGNPLAQITSQFERTNVFGFNFHLDKYSTWRNTFLLGADLYHERVTAPAFSFNPVTGTAIPSRPRVPQGARYLSYGFFAQDAYEVIPQRLRLSSALRFQVASYRSRAANSPLVNGQPLFPNDSLRVGDFAGRVGLVVTPIEGFDLAFTYSRGFRAPNMTDLGTLGLTGDGFEIAAPDVASLGSIIGSTADASAVATGLPVTQQRSELSNNFDFSLRFHNKRIDTDLTGFLIDLNDTITKQALILPPGAIGLMLGDQRIERQLPNGVVFVPLSTAPVLVRANFSDARLTGLEYSLTARLTNALRFGGNFTYVHAEDKATGLPPDIEGGTPAPLGFVRLRYAPPAKRYWLETYATLAYRQSRISSLALADRRTGGTRSRTSIERFFQNGARARGLIAPGPDNQFNTPDDILRPTGETLAQVQQRVLGNATSAPLFPALPGYGLINLRGGVRLSDRSEVSLDFENIADKSYRGVSWGVDGPGRSVTVRYRYHF